MSYKVVLPEMSSAVETPKRGYRVVIPEVAKPRQERLTEAQIRQEIETKSVPTGGFANTLAKIIGPVVPPSSEDPILGAMNIVPRGINALNKAAGEPLTPLPVFSNPDLTIFTPQNLLDLFQSAINNTLQQSSVPIQFDKPWSRGLPKADTWTGPPLDIAQDLLEAAGVPVTERWSSPDAIPAGVEKGLLEVGSGFVAPSMAVGLSPFMVGTKAAPLVKAASDMTKVYGAQRLAKLATIGKALTVTHMLSGTPELLDTAYETTKNVLTSKEPDKATWADMARSWVHAGLNTFFTMKMGEQVWNPNGPVKTTPTAQFTAPEALNITAQDVADTGGAVRNTRQSQGPTPIIGGEGVPRNPVVLDTQGNQLLKNPDLALFEASLRGMEALGQLPEDFVTMPVDTAKGGTTRGGKRFGTESIPDSTIDNLSMGDAAKVRQQLAQAGYVLDTSTGNWVLRSNIDTAGGQVSFGAPVESGIPSGRQSGVGGMLPGRQSEQLTLGSKEFVPAKDTVPPKTTQPTPNLPEKATVKDLISSTIEQFSTWAKGKLSPVEIERIGKTAEVGDLPRLMAERDMLQRRAANFGRQADVLMKQGDPSWQAVMSTAQAVHLKAQTMAELVRKVQNIQKRVPIEKRGAAGGNVSLVGLFDPANWSQLFKPGVPIEAKQIYNRLRNLLGEKSAAWQAIDTPEFRGYLVPGTKLTTEQVAKWMEKNQRVSAEGKPLSDSKVESNKQIISTKGGDQNANRIRENAEQVPTRGIAEEGGTSKGGPDMERGAQGPTDRGEGETLVGTKDSFAKEWDHNKLYGQELENYVEWIRSIRDRLPLEKELKEWRLREPALAERTQRVEGELVKRLQEIESGEAFKQEAKPVAKPVAKTPLTRDQMRTENLKVRLKEAEERVKQSGYVLQPGERVLGQLRTFYEDVVSGKIPESPLHPGNFKEVAQLMLDILPEDALKLPMLQRSHPRHGAFYDALFDHIALVSRRDPGTFIHEGVHAGLWSKMTRDITDVHHLGPIAEAALDTYLLKGTNPRIKALIRLWREAKKHDTSVNRSTYGEIYNSAGDRTIYGFTSFQEFLAESLGDKRFVTLLDSIRAPGTGSLLTRIYRIMASLLTKNPQQETLLTATLRELVPLLQESRPKYGTQNGPVPSPALPSTYTKAMGRTAYDLAKDIGRTGADAVRAYAEPIFERLSRLGGEFGNRISREAGQIVSRGKLFYGELTGVLDPAKKEAGRLTSRGSIWMKGLNEVTPSAATNNFFALFEGKRSVPAYAKHLYDLLKAANFRIGKLAERGTLYFEAGGKLQRMLTAFGVDIVRRGGGRAWNAWTEGLAKANGVPVDKVRTFFRRWKDQLDKPGVDVAHLDKIAQDFKRVLPNTITHIKTGLAWHEVVSASPFAYLEGAAQRVATAVAFREVYKPGSGLLAATRAAINRHLSTDRASLEFEHLIRALQGHPIDSFTRGWNAPDTFLGGSARMAQNVVAAPIRALVLTGNFLANVSEVFFGGPTIYAGFPSAMKTLLKIVGGRDFYKQLEMNGAVNRAMLDMAFDPTSPIRSLSRIGGGTVRRLFAEQILNELQEAQGAAVAKMLADRARAKDLSPREIARLSATLEQMGFDVKSAKKAAEGLDNEGLLEFERRAPSFLTAGHQTMAERSLMGASRWFNELFWFHSYPQMVMNQLRSGFENLFEAVERKDGKAAWQHAKILGRQVGGRALQGAFAAGIYAWVMEGGKTGVQERTQEMKDNPLSFIADVTIASMSGPLFLLKRALEHGGSASSLGATLAAAVAPLSIGGEMMDAAMGNGKYEGMSATERIGTFLESKTPGYRAVRAGLAAYGLADYDNELETARKAFYRWRRSEKGWKQTTFEGADPEDVAFRMQMRRAMTAMRQGKDWKSELMKAGEPKQVAASLYARTLLRNPNGESLSDADIEALEKRIGVKLVARLRHHDAMIREVARSLSESKDFEKIPDQPTGALAVDFEAGTRRQARVASSLPADVQEFAKANRIDIPTYAPKVAGGRDGRLLTIEEDRVMQQKVTELYEKFLRQLMARGTNFTSLSQERKDRIASERLELARRRAASLTRQELVTPTTQPMQLVPLQR